MVTGCFNPVLGFLSVSTRRPTRSTNRRDRFQSRAGFSECLDLTSPPIEKPVSSFNPVLGFLSVSTTHLRT